MYASHRKEGLEILGVAFVEGGKRGQESLAKYMTERRMSWTNVMAGFEWFGKPLQDYDVTLLPFNVLLDRKGRVVGVNLHDEALEQKLRPLLHGSR